MPNCTEDKSLGRHFNHRQQIPEYRKVPMVERGVHPFFWTCRGRAHTWGALSPSSSVTLLRATLQSPSTRGKENLTLWQEWLVLRPWGSGRGNVCGLGERGSALRDERLWLLYFAFQIWNLHIYPSNNISRKHRNILENDNSMCWVRNSGQIPFTGLRGDLWAGEMASLFTDGTTRCPVCVPVTALSQNYMVSLGEQPDKLQVDLFQRGNVPCKALFSLKHKENDLPPFSLNLYTVNMRTTYLQMIIYITSFD